MELFQDIVESLKEAIAIEEGKKSSSSDFNDVPTIEEKNNCDPLTLKSKIE